MPPNTASLLSTVDTAPFPAGRPSTGMPVLRPYQVEVAQAVLDSIAHGRGRTFSVMISRQGGKNELSALLELRLLQRYAGSAVENIKAAPTFEPQGRVSLRRLWTRLLAAGAGRLAGIEHGNCVCFGRARQFFLSAAPGASVAGHTCHLLLEVDEAQDVAAETFDRQFRPMAAANNATTVYYGTAWSDHDLLAEVRDRHLAMERGDGIRRHFEYDWRTVARTVPAYAAFVEQERQRLGEQHPLFRTQYLLEPLSAGGRLFSPAQRALVRGRHHRRATPGGELEPGRLLGYVAGLDIGGEILPGTAAAAPLPPFETPGATSRPVTSPDWTVLTIARVLGPAAGALVQEPDVEVVEHAAWQGAAHADLMRGLARLLREVWRVRRLVIDATGIGEGIASALAALDHRSAAARAADGGVVNGSAPGSGIRVSDTVTSAGRDGAHALAGGSAGPPAGRPPASARTEIVRLRLTEERKSALGFGLLSAVNSGRLRLYQPDGSPEATELWRELELARAEYRPNQRLAWFVGPRAGHDDFVMSLALTVEAARGLEPRVARGRG